jgi:hypothetical protein
LRDDIRADDLPPPSTLVGCQEAHQLVVGVYDREVLTGLRDHRERAATEDLLEENWVTATPQVLGREGVSQ